jgi:hypothetical protein
MASDERDEVQEAFWAWPVPDGAPTAVHTLYAAFRAGADWQAERAATAATTMVIFPDDSGPKCWHVRIGGLDDYFLTPDEAAEAVRRHIRAPQGEAGGGGFACRLNAPVRHPDARARRKEADRG